MKFEATPIPMLWRWSAELLRTIPGIKVANLKLICFNIWTSGGSRHLKGEWCDPIGLQGGICDIISWVSAKQDLRRSGDQELSWHLTGVAEVSCCSDSGGRSRARKEQGVRRRWRWGLRWTLLFEWTRQQEVEWRGQVRKKLNKLQNKGKKKKPKLAGRKDNII